MNTDAISNYRKKLISTLDSEARVYGRGGGYLEWYKCLKPFRRALKKYVWGKINGVIITKVTRLKNGNIIDHHAAGYYAPLSFERIGFDGLKCTPSEQIINLNNQFKGKNIRFIYVSLPCKGAIYPELIVPKKVIKKCCNVIPQWRKMIREIAIANVEVIDIYPSFISNKEVGVFSKDHFISEQGSRIVAKEIYDYLMLTSTEDIAEMLSNRTIGVFGDCNLQAGISTHTDITSFLSEYFSCDIDNLGRALPFCTTDKITKIKSSINEKELLIYVGFPSSAFVRTSTYPYKGIGNLLRMYYLLLFRQKYSNRLWKWCTEKI